jgi:hypothetical protein
MRGDAAGSCHFDDRHVGWRCDAAILGSGPGGGTYLRVVASQGEPILVRLIDGAQEPTNVKVRG